MPNARAIGLCCLQMAGYAATERSVTCVPSPTRQWDRSKMSSLHSPDAGAGFRAPLRPLLVKELRELASGRAFWTMLLLACVLIGYGFFQAVALYADASA